MAGCTGRSEDAVGAPERIRRRAEEERVAAIASGTTHPFDPAMPWDYCLKAAAVDRYFWEEELDRKCMLYITHLKSQKQLTDAGHGAELAGDSRGGAGSSSRRLPPATRKRASDDQGGGGNSSGGRGRGRGRGGKGAKSQGRGSARMPDGRWRVDDKGKEIPRLRRVAQVSVPGDSSAIVGAEVRRTARLVLTSNVQRWQKCALQSGRWHTLRVRVRRIAQRLWRSAFVCCASSPLKSSESSS